MIDGSIDGSMCLVQAREWLSVSGMCSSGHSFKSSPGCYQRPVAYDYGEVQPGVPFDINVFVADFNGNPIKGAPLTVYPSAFRLSHSSALQGTAFRMLRAIPSHLLIDWLTG
jgi:hypothetical protein